MPDGCACMRTGNTLNAIYDITNVPVLQNTMLLAINLSTRSNTEIRVIIGDSGSNIHIRIIEGSSKVPEVYL